MKNVLKTILFHIICIVTFALVYKYLSNHFNDISNNKNNKTFLDYFSLSTTIQCGVGLTYLDPTSVYSKVAVLFQQLLLISTHVITIYLFTL